MSFQEEIYYKIEAYLGGELDAEEVAAFEKEISSDDLLKAEVEKHKVANALIMQQRLFSVKNILQEEQLKSSTPNNPFKPLGFVLVAAVAVGIGASVWMLNKDDDSTSSKSAASEIISGVGQSKNSISEETKMNALKKASKQNVPVEDVGFHKQQIQQIEEHLHTDEKGILHIDSSFIAKRTAATTPVNIPAVSNTESTTSKINTPLDPCANVAIEASIKSEPTCNHKPTGNILVSNINGGKKPYSVSIAATSDEAVVNGELGKGVYYTIVSDANGCTHKYSNIVITEKECPIDYSFNPFYGDEELYIGPQDTEGHIEIYDKGGVLYYQRTIPAVMPFKWSGVGNSNQIIPGYYIFVIKYANGTSKRGSITIVQ